VGRLQQRGPGVEDSEHCKFKFTASGTASVGDGDVVRVGDLSPSRRDAGIVALGPASLATTSQPCMHTPAL